MGVSLVLGNNFLRCLSARMDYERETITLKYSEGVIIALPMVVEDAPVYCFVDHVDVEQNTAEDPTPLANKKLSTGMFQIR